MSRPGVRKFRVLWTDAAGDGRFTDVMSDSAPAAAWQAAVDADSQSAIFVTVISLEDGLGLPREG